MRPMLGIWRIGLTVAALCAAQPAYAQITPHLDAKLDAAEKALDADIKACRAINLDDYDALARAAFRNQSAMLKALGEGAKVDPVQAGKDARRAEALLDRAKAAAAGPCKPPEKQAHPAPAPSNPKVDLTEGLDPGKVDPSNNDLSPAPKPDKAPPPAKKKPGSSQSPKGVPTGKPLKPLLKLLPKGKGETGYLLEGPPRTPFQHLRARASLLFGAIDDAFDRCDEDLLDKLFAEIKGDIGKTQAMIASGTLNKDEAAEAEALLQDLKKAQFSTANLPRCPKMIVVPEHLKPGPKEPATPEPTQPGKSSTPGNDGTGKSATPKVDLKENLPKPTLPHPDLSPMGTEGALTAPQAEPRPAASPAEKPTPPKISIIDDIREPPTPFEVNAIKSRVDELGKLTRDYPHLLEGCHPDIWDKHIASLEDLAKRARQIAEDVKRGYSNGVTAKDAEQVANDAQKAVEDAKRGKAANLEQWRAPECPRYTPLPEQPKVKQSSASPYTLTPFAARVLTMHNAERTAIGAQPLRWNPALEQTATAYAQQLARTGQLTHAPREGRGIERENINQGLIGWNTDQMMRNWLDEKRHFRAGLFPNVCEGDWSQCAHYSQMIWPTTTDLGCGMAPGGGFRWLVCRYSPGGNKDGKPVGYRGSSPALSAPPTLVAGPLLFEKLYSPVLKGNRPANPDNLEFGDDAVYYWGVFEYARDFGHWEWAFANLDKLKLYAEAAHEHSVEELSKGNRPASEQYAAMAKQIDARVAVGEQEMSKKGYRRPR